MNSKQASATRLAFSTERLPSSHGRMAVPAPKGSARVFFMACQ